MFTYFLDNWTSMKKGDPVMKTPQNDYGRWMQVMFHGGKHYTKNNCQVSWNSIIVGSFAYVKSRAER